MIICKNCGKELEDNAKMCDECGALIVGETDSKEQVSADVDNIVSETDSKGQVSVDGDNTDVSVKDDGTDKKAGVIGTIKKVMKNKKAIYAGLGVVAVIALCIVVSIIKGTSGSSADVNYSLYIKDKELYYADFADKEPIQVTVRMFDVPEGISNSEIEDLEYLLSHEIRLSDDGRLLFYPEKIDDTEMSGGISLYYRNIKNKKSERCKVDSDVYAYYINDSATVVTYIKGDSRSLYQYSVKKNEKTKIATEVDSMFTSDDGKKIVYTDKDKALYEYVKGETVKVDTDVEYLLGSNDKNMVEYYIKEDSLYKKEFGEQKIKIASGVDDIIKVYESGELYYSKKDTDDNGNDSYSLYYYDGTLSVKLSDVCIYTPGHYYVGTNYAYDTPAIVYLAPEDDEIVAKISVKGATYALDVNSLSTSDSSKYREYLPDVSRDGKTVYYLNDINDEGYGDLYKLSVTKNGPSEPKLYDSDVYYNYRMRTGGGKYVYIKYYNSGASDGSYRSYGEMYMDKKLVDYEASLSRFAMYEDVIMFFSDYSDGKGTLKMFKKGKSKMISEDVHDFELLSEDCAVYLYDYSNEYNRGELFVYKNGKQTKIDDDVVCVIN